MFSYRRIILNLFESEREKVENLNRCESSAMRKRFSFFCLDTEEQTNISI